MSIDSRIDEEEQEEYEGITKSPSACLGGGINIQSVDVSVHGASK